VEYLYIEKNLEDQSIANISNPDRIKWAINSFNPYKYPELGLNWALSDL